MPTKREIHKFPCYLRGDPNHPTPEDSGKWLGRKLRVLRERRGLDLEQIARKSGFVDQPIHPVTAKEIGEVEEGKLWITLGELRQIIICGYGTSLTALLKSYFQEHRAVFDPDKNRRFDRDSHYSLRLDGRDKTPLFIGGHPEHFRWAVPVRQLQGQPLVTEYLELPPRRTAQGKEKGTIPHQTHMGVEVICVIHGTIEVFVVRPYKPEEHTRELVGQKGQCVHLDARCKHQLTNSDKSCALLLLVRWLPEEMATPSQNSSTSTVPG